MPSPPNSPASSHGAAQNCRVSPTVTEPKALTTTSAPTVIPQSSTAEAEPEIDLVAVHGDLVQIERELAAAKAKHNAFLVELGLAPLP